MKHLFTNTILNILKESLGDKADYVFSHSELIQYLNYKTKSANSGPKSRGSFANLYAIYVLVEDYLDKGYHISNNYAKYEGAEYTNLLNRQRNLPFGSKLQNHALNNRMKEEFKKYFPVNDLEPIVRDLKTNRYWINENLLKIKIDGNVYNIATEIINIINAYIVAKQDAFQKFIQVCIDLQNIEYKSTKEIENFILSLLSPTADARIFEIVSYAILKLYYDDKTIFWGFTNKKEEIFEESLKLYKTGRTNANDGGIDFVMKPLGRFFQVTETLDFKKYFLDIDKVEKYPISFVIKTNESVSDLYEKIKSNALKTYVIESVVKNYLSCIEELINIPILIERFGEVKIRGNISLILNEIIIQSKVEFNYE